MISSLTFIFWSQIGPQARSYEFLWSLVSFSNFSSSNHPPSHSWPKYPTWSCIQTILISTTKFLLLSLQNKNNLYILSFLSSFILFDSIFIWEISHNFYQSLARISLWGPVYTHEHDGAKGSDINVQGSLMPSQSQNISHVLRRVSIWWLVK